MTGGALRRLTGAGAEERWRVHCYVLNGAEGEPFAPPRDGAGPWQAGVLYTDRDPEESTLDEALDAGGVLLSVDFGVPESPPASTEADDNPSSLWTEAEGEPALLHRTAPMRLAAVWFAGRSDERVRVILMTGGDERRALELMAAVEPGVPGA